MALDILTGATHCDCKAAECGRECWHQTLAPAAWDGHSARILAGKYDADQLHRAGRKAHRMCRIYRERIGRCFPVDQLALLVCRAEWRRRAAIPAAAPIAA